MELGNLRSFLAALSRLGVPPHSLFEPEDLYERRNLGHVGTTLEAFAHLIEADPTWKGPRLSAGHKASTSPSVPAPIPALPAASAAPSPVTRSSAVADSDEPLVSRSLSTAAIAAQKRKEIEEKRAELDRKRKELEAQRASLTAQKASPAMQRLVSPSPQKPGSPGPIQRGSTPGPSQIQSELAAAELRKQQHQRAAQEKNQVRFIT